jgi:hypothetical protein
MNKKASPNCKFILAVITAISLLLAGCAPRPIATPPPQLPTAAPVHTEQPTLAPTSNPSSVPTSLPSPVPTIIPSATATPLADISIDRGQFYFSVGDTPTFLLGRNPTGIKQADFDPLLEWTKNSGSKLVRVHLTHGWWDTPWITNTGQVNESWVKNWEGFFDQAAADGIYVMPVFAIWADWNSGKPDLGSDGWKYNPLNTAWGGPFNQPAELFQDGSTLQGIWLNWMEIMVERWQTVPNIAAWEIFSEINIATGLPGTNDPMGGVDEKSGEKLIKKAAAIIRTADTKHRPITASLAGTYGPTDPWTQFYHIDSLDFIQIHPYNLALDTTIISDVRQKLDRYKKPVLIGESGMDAYLNSNADPYRMLLGIQHATWAGIVSGAMNGRFLWFEDGYAVYWDANDRTKSAAFLKFFAETEKPAANFVNGVNFSNFKPLVIQVGSKVKGAAVGNDKFVIGWFRDAGCEPPDWRLQPVISGQTVRLTVPGSTPNWKIDFYDTKTGTDITSSTTVIRKGSQITVSLPDFKNDIAFKMYNQ